MLAKSSVYYTSLRDEDSIEHISTRTKFEAAWHCRELSQVVLKNELHFY